MPEIFKSEIDEFFECFTKIRTARETLQLISYGIVFDTVCTSRGTQQAPNVVLVDCCGRSGRRSICVCHPTMTLVE